jgi:hypothetical protein
MSVSPWIQDFSQQSLQKLYLVSGAQGVAISAAGDALEV